jgi:hypothetical protein
MASDPISWQLANVFPNPVIVGRDYTITYTLTNNLPFKLVKPLNVTSKGGPTADFRYVDGCSGVYLASNASCTVAVTMTPLTSGNKTYQLTFSGYANDVVHLPWQETTATGEVQSGVVGTASLSLPGALTSGSPGSYQFTYTNFGQTTASDLQVVVTAVGGGVLSTPTTSCGTSVTALTSSTPSCTVSGTYTPNSSTPSSQTVTGTLTFTGATGSPSSPFTTTIISVPAGDIVGSLVSPKFLPPLMVVGTYPVQFLFTNTTATAINISTRTFTCTTSAGPACTFTPSGTPANDNCQAGPLSGNASCQLLGSLTVPSLVGVTPKEFIVKAFLEFTGTGTPATITSVGTQVTTLPPAQRTVTLVNNCPFTVSYSLNGAALAGYTPPSCPLGTSSGPSNTCFWNNPLPNTGTYQLAANNGQSTVLIPAYNYGGVQWSGNISASTKCSGTSCLQADCGNFTTGTATSCLVGQGFSQPATQAEITMNATTGDSYDVEVINGFHIPISMQPVYDNTSTPNVAAVPNNYTCGTAGELTATNGFGACNWSANTVAVPAPVNGTGLSSGYYWVLPNGSPCNITSAIDQCSTSTTGQLCGLSINRSNNVLTQNCGLFIGYWSADQVCSYSGLSSTVNTFFSCTQALPTAPPSPTPTDVYFPANSTLFHLLKCQVPSGDLNPLFNSCYLNYSGYTEGQINTCCGCVDWWTVNNNGTLIASNNNADSCGSQQDPQWTQYIQPMIQWMKAACPSAYIFPFDDKSSSFGCSNNLTGQTNSVGYTITFCKGGNSGLPYAISAANDGRI